MKLRFHIDRSRRELLPALALLFLLQSIAPAFIGVAASPVAGYTDILCTMSGPQRVFVAFEDPDERKTRACHECPSCVLKPGIDDAALPGKRPAVPQTRPSLAKPAEGVHPVLPARSPNAYLSRAPPA